MKEIQEIVDTFHALAPASGNRWNIHTVVPNRLHISRGPSGEYAVFVEGDRASFATLPAYTGLEHSSAVVGNPTGRKFAALRLASDDELIGNRVMAHIAYELSVRLETDPQVPNAALLEDVGWVLQLLGARESVLSVEYQKGLAGECTLLWQLLRLAHRKGLPALTVLDRWWGWNRAKRDFAADGLAIEVKTTGRPSRQHTVETLDQLDPQSDGEEVYVFSVGLKADPTAPKKLPHFVADVEAQLVRSDGSPDEAAIARFREQARAYGYDPAHEELYMAGPGYLRPHLVPALFREADLDRLRMTSFVGGSLPSMVVAVSYMLDIRSPEVPEVEAEKIYERLLMQPPTSERR